MLCSSPVVTEQQERDGGLASTPPRQPASTPPRQPASTPRRRPASIPRRSTAPPPQPASTPPQPASTPPHEQREHAEEREAERSFPSPAQHYHDATVHIGIDELQAYIDARLSTTERQNQELVNLVKRKN